MFTDPEGDSCFSIYQISWVKLKKATFGKLKRSLSRNFVYNLQTFRGFCQVHFTILLQIQNENNFLSTSKQWQAKVRRFLGICSHDCFIYLTNFVFRKCLERKRHLGFGRKTVNGQGYSMLREPIKTRKNCYSLSDLVNTKLGYIYTLTDCFSCRQEKLSSIVRTHVHKAPKSGKETFPICGDPFSTSAPLQLRCVTEIGPKSAFLCVNRSAIWYGFRASAKSIHLE